MKAFPIPVRSIGPGSQPADEVELDVMPMPRGMATFEMPRVPEQVPAAVLREAAEALRGFLQALQGWDPATQAHGPERALDGLSAAALTVCNEVLGEGEVAVRIDAESPLQMQESVFGGVWLCGERDRDGRLLRYGLEAGSVPRAVATSAAAASGVIPAIDAWPEGVMNAPALIAEIRARLQAGQGGQINLTLLPLTPQDHAVLAQALPVGRVAMISRGFGNCHVSSTTLRGVWRVQYFNSMNTLILDTIELAPVPEVALASPDDLADSRQRLAELVQWMDESAAEAELH